MSTPFTDGFRPERWVERLRSHGFRAQRIEEGVAEWKDRGLPVAAGTQ